MIPNDAMNPGQDGRPLVVTLGLDAASFDRLDGLRGRYFPPDRNLVPAHISLFHHLPGSEVAAVAEILAAEAAKTPAFPVRFGSLFKLGRGFASRLDSGLLAALHARLASQFDAWLTPQDRQPYRPHVTLMNKAEPAAVKRAWHDAGIGWGGWQGTGESVLLWRYAGGPWDAEAAFPLARTSVDP